MKKLIKNKFIVLAITIIVVSIVYFGIQKAIDNYTFKTNSDINTEDEIKDSEKESKESQEYSDDDINFVLEENIGEEQVENTSDENVINGENTGEEVSMGINGESVPKSSENKIYVYITGEVNVPGVVILDEGSRIVDAINSAGGTTSKANISKVNLVYVLEDGMKVNIPSDNDLKNNPDFEYITMSSGDGRNDNSSGSDGTNSSSSNSSASNSSGLRESQSSSRYSIVNINTATQTELETLPGIGPSLALKIINYRNENGKFSSIEEIKNVSGIGESKFEDLKNYITI